MSELVTFGKYRNQPISTLLADQKYTQWILNNPTFKDHPIYAVINQIQSPAENQPTPEHNKLQNLFMDQAFLDRFAIQLLTPVQLADYEKKTIRSLINVEEIRKEIEAKYRWKHVEEPMKNLKITTSESQLLFNIAEREEVENQLKVQEFEPICGADIRLHMKIFQPRYLKVTPDWVSAHYYHCPNHEDPVHYCTRQCDNCKVQIEVIKETYKAIQKQVQSFGLWNDSWDHRDVYVEVKPLLGDDYPAVLRQMKQQQRRIRDTHFIHVLFVQCFQSEATTAEQVRRIFALDEIRVILQKDLK